MSDIGYAIEALKAGKKVQRKIWTELWVLTLKPNSEYLVLLKDGGVYDDDYKPAWPSLIATDWEVVE